VASRHNAYIGNLSPGWEWKTEGHWDDLVISPMQGTGGAALTYSNFRDTPYKMLSFVKNQSDELHVAYQLPHSWDPGTECKFHIHATPLVSPAAGETVQFSGYYVWVGTESIIPELSGWTAFSSTWEIADECEAFCLDVVPLFSSTPPATLLESSILLVYIKRDVTNPHDSYGHPIGMVSMDLHIQRNKMGTLNEYPGAT
jgi:hypothetical protein